MYMANDRTSIILLRAGYAYMFNRIDVIFWGAFTGHVQNLFYQMFAVIYFRYERTGEINVWRLDINNDSTTGHQIVGLESEYKINSVIYLCFSFFGVPYCYIHGAIGKQRTQVCSFKYLFLQSMFYVAMYKHAII